MQPPTSHPDDWYRSRLAPPTGRVRVVIDTDTANEIDDQFALAWALMALTFLGAYSYSSPPFKLVNTGLGEVTASITVAGLVPAMGHVLQAGQPSFLVVLATAPLAHADNNKAAPATTLSPHGMRRGSICLYCMGFMV